MYNVTLDFYFTVSHSFMNEYGNACLCWVRYLIAEIWHSLLSWGLAESKCLWRATTGSAKCNNKQLRDLPSSLVRLVTKEYILFGSNRYCPRTQLNDKWRWLRWPSWNYHSSLANSIMHNAIPYIAIPEGFEFSAAFQSVVLSTVPSSRRVMHPTARLSRRIANCRTSLLRDKYRYLQSVE